MLSRHTFNSNMYSVEVCSHCAPRFLLLKLQVDELRHDVKDKVKAETKEADKRTASPGAVMYSLQ